MANAISLMIIRNSRQQGRPFPLISLRTCGSMKVTFHFTKGFLTALLLLLALATVPSALAQPSDSLIARGRLVNQDGDSASFVTVLLEVADRGSRVVLDQLETKSGADGSFQFDLSEFDQTSQFGLEFSIRSPRYRQVMEVVLAERSEFPVEVLLTVEPGSVVAGRVVDDMGAPLGGALVYNPGGPSTETKEDGSFELFGLPRAGQFAIVAEQDGYIINSLRVESEDADLIEGVVIELRAASDLKGIVLRPDGEPADRGVVRVMLDRQTLSSAVSPTGEFLFRAAPADVTGVPVGVDHPDFLFSQRPLTDSEKESRTIELRLGWPLCLRGQVTTPDGEPLAGCRILVESQGGDGGSEYRQAATDDAGEWEICGIEPGGQHAVMAIPPAAEPRRAAGELDFQRQDNAGVWIAEVNPWPSGAISQISATLEDLTIRMVRTDSGKGAMPGKILYEGEITPDFSMMSGTVVMELMGAEGEFRARKYQPGGSLLGVWDLRENFQAGETVFAPGFREIEGLPYTGFQVADLALPSPAPLTGRVLGDDGEPPIEGTVMLYEWNGRNCSDCYRRETEILAGGRFEFQGLPPGHFRIIAVNPQGQPITEPEFIVAGVQDFVLGADFKAEEELDSLE